MLTAIACHEGGRSGQTAARALTIDRDPTRVDAERIGLGKQPFQRGIAIFYRSGERRLGSQPILDGDHYHAQTLGKTPTRTIHHVGTAADETTARDVQ